MAVKITESAVLNAPVERVWDTVRRMDFVWDPRIVGVKAVGRDDREVLSWTVGDSAAVMFAGPGGAYFGGGSQFIRFTALSDAERTVRWESGHVAAAGATADAKAAPAFKETLVVRGVTANNTTFVEWTTEFVTAPDAAAVESSKQHKRESFALLSADVVRPFTFHSTADEVVAGAPAGAVKGRTFIVTGGTNGIGFETARALAAHGAHVVLTARDSKKAADAVTDIKRKHSGANVDGLVCALDSFKSIRAFAKEYIARGFPLHVLILNAGVMGTPYGKTEDGFETQFGVNHVGHFLLTSLLLPTLKKSASSAAPGRVVVLSSSMHMAGDVNWNDVNFSKPGSYDPWLSYGQSKTANILFAKQLNAIMKAENTPITANAVHPGVILTGLIKHADNAMAKAKADAKDGDSKAMPARNPMPITIKSLGEGAASTLVAAVREPYGTDGGFYFSDCNPAKPYKAYAEDMKAAVRLWELTEKLIADVKA